MPTATPTTIRRPGTLTLTSLAMAAAVADPEPGVVLTPIDPIAEIEDIAFTGIDWIDNLLAAVGGEVWSTALDTGKLLVQLWGGDIEAARGPLGEAIQKLLEAHDIKSLPDVIEQPLDKLLAQVLTEVVILIVSGVKTLVKPKRTISAVDLIADNPHLLPPGFVPVPAGA